MARRRSNNEGSITQRPNGSWRAQVMLEGKRLSFSAKTRRECQTWLKYTIGQIDEGLSYCGATLQLKTYIEGWLKTIQENRRPTTYTQYEIIVRLYILPAFGDYRLKDLRPQMIETNLTEKRGNGVGARTCQLIYAIFHVIMESALRKGLVGRNPMDAVEKPKVLNPRKKVILTPEQIQQLLIVAIDDQEEVFYQVAIHTGMREGEMLGLKWEDLDFQRGRLKVQRQVQRLPKKGLVFSPPKTESGNRVLALGTPTLNLLKVHQERQELARARAGQRWLENGLIFPTVIGTPRDPHNLIKEFRKLLVRTGLPSMRFHDLRHTSITLLLNEIGVPIKEAQRRAGHASPTTTLSIYGGEVTTKMDETSAQQLDVLITPLRMELPPNCTKEKSQALNNGR